MRIGETEERFAVAHPFIRIRGYPDADGHPDWTAGLAEVMGRDSSENPFGKVARLGTGGLRQEHDELLSAIARDYVHRPLLPLQQVGQLLEHAVTHQVAVG